jgi:dTDP-4-dehydrorhamnose reductase
MVTPKMHILLFGNKGQIGQEIEKSSQIKKIKISGLDIDDVDIADISKLETIFKQNTETNIVINAAAYTNVEQAEDEPQKAYQTNHMGAQNLALICRQHSKPLLHLSTDYVFSGEKTGPYTEDDTTNPLNIYGKSKLAGDNAIENTWHKHVILRISWLFGAYGNNFVKTILRLAQERDILNVVGDQAGCPTAAADVARVLLEIAEKISQGQESWGIYNYCNSPVTTWHELATKIIEIGHDKFQIKAKQINKTTTESFPTKAKRPKNSELLVAKINEDYGILRKDWNDFLPEVINSFEPIQ